MGKTVLDVIREASGLLPPADTYYLLGFALNRPKEFLLTYPEYELEDQELKSWYSVRERRIGGEPAAYITGFREFYSLSFRVNRHTLIPRPETELLVDEVIRRKPGTLLDVGTGSGCIAVAVSYHLHECRITAVDVSDEALKIARENASRLLRQHSITFIRSNYFENLSDERFDAIVSNPPYVRSGMMKDLEREVAHFEPAVALDGGSDGLAAYRTLLGEGGRFLMPGGVMMLEISPELREEVEKLARRKGYRTVEVEKDLSGHDRMMVLGMGGDATRPLPLPTAGKIYTKWNLPILRERSR